MALDSWRGRVFFVFEYRSEFTNLYNSLQYQLLVSTAANIKSSFTNSNNPSTIARFTRLIPSQHQPRHLHFSTLQLSSSSHVLLTRVPLTNNPPVSPTYNSSPPP